MLIGLQSGHQNITTNIDPLLRPGTGAAGEMEFNVKVRDVLGQILIAYGFQVQLDDANANSSTNTIGKDFDFYLAIHAESAPPGGEVAAPDPSVDASNTESKRIVAAIEHTYFPDTGIADVEQIDSANMDYYYMWNVLTAKTPCGIIECGDLADPHDSVILADIRRVALGIAHGLCDAFNFPWNGDPANPPTPPVQVPPTPPPTPPPVVGVDYKPFLVSILGVLNDPNQTPWWAPFLKDKRLEAISAIVAKAGIGTQT